MTNGINKIDWIKLGTFGLIYQVSQQNAAIVERFGRYKKVGTPGLNLKIPFIDQIVATQNLKIQQTNVKVATKTKDNVFLEVMVSVQYRINDGKQNVANSYYKLESVIDQINAYVFDMVRAEIPKLTLDDAFEKKDEVAKNMKSELGESLNDFGYYIVKTLVTDIIVDDRIVQAMNEIVASEREKEAAIQKGETEKIMMVKKAEAEAESKKLQGQGTAEQRKAIIKGFQDSVQSFKDETGVDDTSQVMMMVLMTQYFDALKDVAQAESNTILIPHSPGVVNDISSQIRESVMVGNIVGKK